MYCYKLRVWKKYLSDEIPRAKLYVRKFTFTWSTASSTAFETNSGYAIMSKMLTSQLIILSTNHLNSGELSSTNVFHDAVLMSLLTYVVQFSRSFLFDLIILLMWFSVLTFNFRYHAVRQGTKKRGQFGTLAASSLPRAPLIQSFGKPLLLFRGYQWIQIGEWFPLTS